MDEERLLKACELVDKGKYSEAHNEFIQLAEDTPDPVEKAWPLIYAANTLQTLGQQEAATAQLNAARTLLEKHDHQSPQEMKSLQPQSAFSTLKTRTSFGGAGGTRRRR
jgi:hypothetical protein